MSRIGRQSIAIPDKVTVTNDGGFIEVQGPLGALKRTFRPEIDITIDGGVVTLKPIRETVDSRALWGTSASHIKNMITGVTAGFTKKMLIEGVGYKWNVNGSNVVLNIGFSHDVTIAIPEGIKVTVEKGTLTVTGFDKELVGQFSAKIRDYKPVEPYKGKGIRYEGEYVRRKQGKKTTA